MDHATQNPRIPLWIAIVAVAMTAGCDDMHRRPDTQSGIALHHGEPGSRPFWNGFARRYIYPPAFDVVDSTNTAVSYHVTASVGDVVATAPLAHPWSPITPVWEEIPAGFVSLSFEGISAGGDTLHLRTIDTIKSPGFEAVNDNPGSNRPATRAADTSSDPSAAASPDDLVDLPDSRDEWRAAGIAGLEAVLKLDKVQHWLDPGGPDPSYPLWVHPSKLLGFLSQGMLYLSQEAAGPAIADEARRVAIASAEFLLSLREPDDAPLAGWTHSYWDGVDRGEHPIYMNQIMAQYPAEAVMAFLDLFDATKDDRWWDAAISVADTYRSTQRPDGTWYLLLLRESGEPANEKLLVPGSVVVFLDRLEHQYGVESYRDVRDAAFSWIMENPVQTFAWEAQFEDTRPRSRYRNLAHLEPTIFARMLFDDYASGNPETPSADHIHMLDIARELLLFVEDQFVVWTHEDAVTRTNWFRDGLKWNGTTPDGGKDWFLPAGLEQYAFYTPIGRTTANIINAYCAGFEATGDDLYRRRARALSRSLTAAQMYHGSGEIPTHLRRTLPEENWLNNSVESARTLAESPCLGG